jgi:Cu-Zn family superoxide dismutase
MRRSGALVAAALTCVALAAFPVLAHARGSDHEPKGGAPRTIALPGDAIFPEGVAAWPGTKRFFVSANSDGAIFTGSLKRTEAELFLPGGADGRTSATGLEVDAKRERLLVAGAATGRAFAYDARDGTLLRKFGTGPGGFLNDVALTPSGDAYVTDSLRPILWRLSAEDIAAGEGGTTTLAPFLDLTTIVPYQPGFNLNGLVATPDGRYLLAVQSNTGQLHRIEPLTGEAQEVDLGGERLLRGDGLELRGRTLYVVRNQDELIVTVRLAKDLLSGRVTNTTTDPSLMFPTTAALLRGRLLVVNSQFDKRTAGQPPVLPFTVSVLPRP